MRAASRRRGCAFAPTRSPSASIRTSRRVLGAFALQLEGGKVADVADRLRRHGGDAQARARARGGARSASPGTRRRSRRRCEALARDFAPIDRLARRAPATAPRWRRNLLRRFHHRDHGRRDRDPPRRRLGASPWLSHALSGSRAASHAAAPARQRLRSTSAGEAVYIDDLPEPAGLLHVYLGLSAKAHARIMQHRPRAGARGAGRGAGADRRGHAGRQRREPDASPRRAAVRDRRSSSTSGQPLFAVAAPTPRPGAAGGAARRGRVRGAAGRCSTSRRRGPGSGWSPSR